MGLSNVAPNICPQCGYPCYMGATVVECTNQRCQHYNRETAIAHLEEVGVPDLPKPKWNQDLTDLVDALLPECDTVEKRADLLAWADKMAEDMNKHSNDTGQIDLFDWAEETQPQSFTPIWPSKDKDVK